jgi:hypothetical protein
MSGRGGDVEVAVVGADSDVEVKEEAFEAGDARRR